MEHQATAVPGVPHHPNNNAISSSGRGGVRGADIAGETDESGFAAGATLGRARRHWQPPARGGNPRILGGWVFGS